MNRGPLAQLLWLRARRDRFQVPVWVLTIAALSGLSSVAVEASFGTLAEREALVRIAVATPSLLMLRGVPQGTDVAALVFFQLFAFLAATVALMNTFLAVRHSRAEEQSGRADLVGATAAGRLLPLVATVLHGAATNVLLGAGVCLAFLAVGFDPTGALLSGAAIAATGLAFLAVGLVCAQLLRTARGANGLAAALVGVAYVLRAAGDAGGTASADGLSVASGWPSWLSPIGWGQQTSPFHSPEPAPLLLSLGFALLLIAAVLGLQSTRDLDASVLPERGGRNHASARLRGSFGLAWRLQWPSILGWSIAGLLLGAIAGGLGETIVDLAESNPLIGGALASIAPGGRGSIIDLFTAALFSLIGVLAAAAAMQSVIRLRQEESGGAGELLLALPVRRIRWMNDYLALGAITIGSVLAAAVTGAGLGLIRSADTADRIASVAGSGFAQLPAALLMLAIAALLYAFVPRVSIALSWAALLAALFVGQFGGVFGLPEWMRAVSPFTHTPVSAVRGADWAGAAVMFGLAVVAAALAVWGARRRDLTL
ncbi:hypothetical protein E3T55_17925 [Cryobacterium frigoriphilum]|uniref:Polyketide antibiotic transporter n=1 Tax=Cryobacterium frigoriphilum TaxID=1259150 RepID=A0A4R8ZUJ1_9MICO|nr:hypothetical protein [Cryobacterium frigoriphilum]TFD45986.1 hypothetical protein E3T55_17925 [Cryobacterium frigoriphilum]